MLILTIACARQEGLSQSLCWYCLNKYGRNFFIKNSNSTLELEDYYRMKFDYAVEDSPKAFRFFEHLPELKVLVFDRPWNRECAFPNGNYQRYADWESIRKIVSGEVQIENESKDL